MDAYTFEYRRLQVTLWVVLLICVIMWFFPRYMAMYVEANYKDDLTSGDAAIVVVKHTSLLLFGMNLLYLSILAHMRQIAKRRRVTSGTPACSSSDTQRPSSDTDDPGGPDDSLSEREAQADEGHAEGEAE